MLVGLSRSRSKAGNWFNFTTDVSLFKEASKSYDKVVTRRFASKLNPVRFLISTSSCVHMGQVRDKIMFAVLISAGITYLTILFKPEKGTNSHGFKPDFVLSPQSSSRKSSGTCSPAWGDRTRPCTTKARGFTARAWCASRPTTVTTAPAASSVSMTSPTRPWPTTASWTTTTWTTASQCKHPVRWPHLFPSHVIASSVRSRDIVCPITATSLFFPWGEVTSANFKLIHDWGLVLFNQVFKNGFIVSRKTR